MAIYLIDYENVKCLIGINELTSKDTAIIFYSKNANTLTFEEHKDLISSKAQILYKNVTVGGKNALDFQLGSYLGYLINDTNNKNAEFCIISKDNGFTYLVSFWKNEKNIDIQLFTNLTRQTFKKEVEENNITLENALKNSSLKLKDNEIKEIVKIISQYKTKQTINKNLMNFFRNSEKVGSITKIIKPYIKDKN